MYWWECVELALNRLGGVAPLTKIYAEVRSIRADRGLSTPQSLEATVRKELEYNSSDSTNWHERRNLFFSVHGIGNGVWGLRANIDRDDFAHDLGETDDPFVRQVARVTITRVVRDTAMTKRLKALHQFRCQLCGSTIPMKDGRSYAEAHHVIPLGEPHRGPDVASNIVVVCPNHHAMLDLGSIRLERQCLSEANGHHVDQVSIDYHNNNIAMTT
jgi:5-methylcytosine-specific restriction endonuclease McrA